MDNILALLGVGVVAVVISLVVAVIGSERTRTRGVFGTVRHELSATAKRKNPYRS